MNLLTSKKNLKKINNFWKKKSNLIIWQNKPKKILQGKNFYQDGLVNISYNCLRKNINEGKANKVAVVFVSEKFEIFKLTYRELENLVDHFINFLLKNFKKKEIFDNVLAIHSSANIVSAISMLACAKLGVTHCVLFDDLSKDAIKIRLNLLKSKIIITGASGGIGQEIAKTFGNFGASVGVHYNHNKKL